MLKRSCAGSLTGIVSGCIMKNGKIPIGGFLLVATIAVVFLYPFRSVEPVFKGRTLKDYVYNSGGSLECSAAVRHFGTNALPDISRALRVRDTAARRALLWVAAHQAVVNVHVRPAEDIHFSALLAYKDILELVHERYLPPAVADSCAFEIRTLSEQGGIDESNACVDILSGMEFVKKNAWSRPPPIEGESTPLANGGR